LKFVKIGLLLLALVGCAPLQPHTKAINILEETGYYGRVYHWEEHNLKPHVIEVVMPPTAPIITSDFHGMVGANGAPRSARHRGIDIYHETGVPIIAAADGVVMKSEVGICWGPTVLIYHGVAHDGKPLYGLYGHMRNLQVKVGEKVKRGQQIAEMGNDIYNSCGGGLHHLHFQVSHNPVGLPIGWGWSYFVGDGFRAPNPHRYWADGEGMVSCYDPDRTYEAGTLTYPLLCDGYIEGY